MSITRTSGKSIVLCTLIALVIGLLISASISSSILLSLLTQATIYALFAAGIGVLLRQSGMVSFGHAAFFGLSSYIIAILLKETGLPAESVLLIALLGIALFAFVLGLIIVRVPGIAFAMLTLAFGQLFYQLASTSRNLTGGADGISIDWPDTLFGVPLSMILHQSTLFALCWAILVLTIALLTLVRISRFGSITEAIRDNPERATFIGIHTMMPRVLVFTLSATITGMAGVLSALNTGFISPESLHWSVSGSALMMVVVGGYRLVWGPAFGAIAFILVKDLIGDYSEHWLALFGIALIVVIVFTEDGVSGALKNIVRRRRGPTVQASTPAPHSH